MVAAGVALRTAQDHQPIPREMLTPVAQTAPQARKARVVLVAASAGRSLIPKAMPTLLAQTALRA